MYVWNHCDQAADNGVDYQMNLSFAIHEATLCKLEAVQILCNLGPFHSNFAEFDAGN